MNIDLQAAISEAREAYNRGVPEGGSVRLGQADALLKMDVGLMRQFRAAIEAADPDLINAPNNLRSFVLSFVCAKWMQHIEDQVIAIYQDEVLPLVSRAEVGVVTASAVHEQVRRRLAKGAKKAESIRSQPGMTQEMAERAVEEVLNNYLAERRGSASVTAKKTEQK